MEVTSLETYTPETKTIHEVSADTPGEFEYLEPKRPKHGKISYIAVFL